MFKLFEDTFRDNLIKFYFQSYLLIERSLRIRSQNQVTIREMLLLGFIERFKKNNRHTVTNIAKYLQISPPIISNSVKSLIRKGYIKKVINHDDNRIYFLELTDKGVVSNRNSNQISEKFVQQSMKKLTLFDIKPLRKAFRVVEEIIDEEHRLLDQEELAKSKKGDK
jgi:DNA-binding MarR family transcriptional regulator